MTREIEESTLPGVGVRYSFVASTGRRVSVLLHHSGHREVFVDDPEDPDRSREILDLDEQDSRVLADLLGGTRVVQDVHEVQQDVEGVTLDWLPINAGSEADGRTIGQLDVRRATGVNVVALLRAGEALPAPGPEQELAAGDTVIVVGAPEDCRRAQDLFRGR